MNSKDKQMTAPGLRDMDQIQETFQRVDHIVLRDYLKNLSSCAVVTLETPKVLVTEIVNGKRVNRERDIKASDRSCFFRVAKLVYDSDENNIQKLTSVYSAAAAIRANIAMIILSDGMTAQLYLGICNEPDNNRITPKAQALYNNIVGNFPGSLDEFGKIYLNNDELNKVVDRCFFSHKKCVISSVSGVASIRADEIDDNARFSQGIEKLLDAMRGEPFAALFIANAVSPEELADIRAEYELLYSTLAPFSKSTLTLNDSQSDGVTRSLTKSLSDTVGTSSSTALSIGTSESHSHQEGKSIGTTDSLGGSVGTHTGVHAGVNGVGASAGMNTNINYSHSIQRTKSYSDTITFGRSTTSTKTEGESASHTSSEAKSDGTTKTHTVGKSLQISYENKTVTDLLSTIDAQLKRIHASESFGMFAASAYFIASNKPVAEMAASTYKAIISGQNTGLEVAAINIWDKDSRSGEVADYLKLIRHPLFELDKLNRVTPASLVSAQELTIQMGLPNQSASGVTVIESASFGRNITKLDRDGKDGKAIHLGSLYHMGQTISILDGGEKKDCAVDLDLQSLSMHTFITGSTGAGKSNTVFQILSELKNAGKTFLVIEPAKGEYKHIFGGKDIRVYGTNPNVTELLRINPFSFPKRIHILEHLDRLVEIFNVCWPMYAAMPAILKEAIERAYVAAGWNLQTSQNCYHDQLFPTFSDVLEQIQIVLNESAYSSDNKGDYTGALSIRIRSLTNGINGMIFTCNSLPDEVLFDNNVIVDLSRVGATETKSLIMGLLVMKLQEHRMAQSGGREQELRHVTVLEEAHNLLKRTSPDQSMDSANLAGKSVEMLANAIAEMRAYGEGFIIADQAPGLMDMSVIRNTNTKIIMRLPDQSDRELVGRAAGLTDSQITELSKLGKGVAAVYQNDWIEAVLCKVLYYDHKDQEFVCPDTLSVTGDDLLKAAILDAILRNKLPDRIKQMDLGIIDSSLPTQFKCRLFEYLASSDKDDKEHQFRTLRKLTYAFFNSSRVMSSIHASSSAEDYRRTVLERLEPSLQDYGDKEKDLVLLMLVREQALRDSDYLPLYIRFADSVKGGIR